MKGDKKKEKLAGTLEKNVVLGQKPNQLQQGGEGPNLAS